MSCLGESMSESCADDIRSLSSDAAKVPMYREAVSRCRSIDHLMFSCGIRVIMQSNHHKELLPMTPLVTCIDRRAKVLMSNHLGENLVPSAGTYRPAIR